MRVHVVDPSAYSRPYDHALCAALAGRGAGVELITSAFAYGETPPPNGYTVRELFYRHALGPPASRIRLASKVAEHVPDMVRYRHTARAADVVHFQWLPVQWIDVRLLPPRPVVLTSHDLLPREPRRGQEAGQRRLYDAVDAVVVHSEYGRRQLVERLGIEAEKVNVIHHGAFEHLVRPGVPLPAELAAVTAPVVLFFGLLRPYKGLEALLGGLAPRSTAPSCGSSGAPGWRSSRCEPSRRPGCDSCPGSSPTRSCRPTSAARISSSCPTRARNASTSRGCWPRRWPSGVRW